MTEQRKGEWYAFSSAATWAVFPIVTVLAYAVLPSLLTLLWSTVFAALFFAVVIVYRGKWRELRSLALWRLGAGVALFIGAFYVFYFEGLARTSPGNAAILVLFGVFNSFLFFNVRRGEPFPAKYKWGAALMVVGAFIVLGRDFSGVNVGDLLVLAGTFFTPVANFYQRKAREFASSETVMFLRSLLTIPPIFLLAYFFGESVEMGAVYAALPYLLINGVLLFGLSKMFWLEAIHRIPVAKSEAMQGFSPLLTLILAWLILDEAPTIWQLASLVPLAVGVVLLTGAMERERDAPPSALA